MISLLLPIIYVAFISLGLPDSLLGSAWPVMGKALNAPLEFAGIISMIIAAGTIVSSLLSDYLNRKLGTGLVTTISVAMTAFALAGFSFAPNFITICFIAVPYGLGAGGVDAALNNYVALHYKARHMSWLHCMWGVGATIGPYIMGHFLTTDASWRGGYRCISILQITLTAILVISLPLWRRRKDVLSETAATAENAQTEESPDEKSPTTRKMSEAKRHTIFSALKISGVPLILLAFFGYSSLEATTGLWASSYLVNFRGVNPVTAARFASFFYTGITVGRFLNGFFAEKIGDRKLIKIGVWTAAAGIIMIALPLSNSFALAGLIVIGLGCAPIYPSIIHSTPANFGAENSQAIVGIQMASAYTGSTFIPPLFGILAGRIGIWLYPFFLVVFAMLILTATKVIARKK